MRNAILVAIALAIPATASAFPLFDKAWTERLVKRELPDYYAWLETIEDRDEERYERLLLGARTKIMTREAQPELYEAWLNHFYAGEHYRSLMQTWRADPANQTDEHRLELISAAEDLHMAVIELWDARLYSLEAQAEQTRLRIADHEINYDVYALETVDRSVGPALED